ncbi:MAG: molecular chaperone DnaJ [Bacteroidales bacterium]|nr:molecular chaperone DnaJ [Bacteroidales bacterium]
MQRTTLFILALLLSLGRLTAQTGHFIPSEFFSSGLINTLCQDKYGSIWIATDYGLNRYDGYKFQTFLHDDDDPWSICDNGAVAMLCDQKGRVWVGIFGGAFGGAFGSGFGGFGGSSRGGARRVVRGSDIRIKVKLSMAEAFKGVEKKVKLNKMVVCPDCQGRGAVNEADIKTCEHCHGTGMVTKIANTILGQMQTSSPCPYCGGEGKKITNPCRKCSGTGLVRTAEEISFKIPAGVQEGMQLTIQGKGNAARGGGVPGNLLVVIEEEAPKEGGLQRNGEDLEYTLNLSVPDAVLGCSVEIPYIDSKLKIKIDPGTQPGKILKLRGKGFPSVNGYGAGDYLIYVQVYIPKRLDRKEKEVMESWRNSSSFTPKS